MTSNTRTLYGSAHMRRADNTAIVNTHPSKRGWEGGGRVPTDAGYIGFHLILQVLFPQGERAFLIDFWGFCSDFAEFPFQKRREELPPD